MEQFFGFLFVVMIGASIWGGAVLAIRWAKHWLARLLLALFLIAAFIAAGTTAVIAGCTAVTGPVNFH